MFWIEFTSAVLLAAVIVWAWRRRRRDLRDRVQGPGLDDDAVDRIIRQGRLQLSQEEPLDLEEIARAEDEFWESEPWDPAEDDRF